MTGETLGVVSNLKLVKKNLLFQFVMFAFWYKNVFSLDDTG